MSSAFGGASSLGIANKLNPSTDTGDSTNTQQNADLVSGLQNAANATGSNTSSNVAVQPTPSIGMNLLTYGGKGGSDPDVFNPFGQVVPSTPNPVSIVVLSPSTVSNSSNPEAPLQSGGLYPSTATFQPTPAPTLPGTIAGMQSSATATGANIQNAANSYNTALSINSAKSTNDAAAAAQIAAQQSQNTADSTAAAALQSGLLTAGGSSSNTLAAQQANAQLFQNTMGAAHQGSAAGQRAAAVGSGVNATLAGQNTTLGTAQDTVNNIVNQENYLATTIQSELQNHTIDAQTAITNINTTISALQAELGSAQGDAANQIKQELNNLTSAVNGLQGSTAAAQLGSSEFWDIFGTVAATAAKVATGIVALT